MDSSEKDELRERLMRGYGKERSYEDQKRLRQSSKARKAARQRERPRRHEWEQEDEELEREQVRASRPASDPHAPTVPCDDEREGEEALVVGLERGAVRVRTERGELAVRTSAGEGGLAVGDRVLIERADAQHVWIRARRSRRTRLSRPDPAQPGEERVIAANVDLGLIVTSAKEPSYKPGLVDRLLVAVSYGGVTPLVCVNKLDLLTTREECAALERALEPLHGLGVPVQRVSVARCLGLAELRAALAGKRAVLVGHSGVGKTSLANALVPERPRATGAVRAADGRGRHTTTSSALIELDSGAEIVDTPGVRQFGLYGIQAAELPLYFPELAALAPACRFRDCSHMVEPDCAVQAAWREGRLARSRYLVYRRLREELA